jgi:cell wall-associated NlpC family hydrolase
MQRGTIPDIRQVIDPLLGTPYAELDCWDLVRRVYQHGFGFDLVRDTNAAALRFQEVWYRGQGDPLTVVEPWDLVIIANDDALPVSDHVGVIVDTQTFVHARPSETGAAIGRLRTWKSRLLQLARLRELL